MEILAFIGIFAILALLVIWGLNNEDRKREQDRLLEKQLLHYRLISHTFRKEFESIWHGSAAYNRSELEALLKKFETDSKLRKELDSAIKIHKKNEIASEQWGKEINYFAFNHLQLIREINRLGKIFTEEHVREIIPFVYQEIDTESEITDLISKLQEYHIVAEDYKDKTKLNLTWRTEVITHPYELDEDGNPKKIDL